LQAPDHRFLLVYTKSLLEGRNVTRNTKTGWR
jgi:hypothetical protein